jgi:hypothetical protein
VRVSDSADTVLLLQIMIAFFAFFKIFNDIKAKNKKKLLHTNVAKDNQVFFYIFHIVQFLPDRPTGYSIPFDKAIFKMCKLFYNLP